MNDCAFFCHFIFTHKSEGLAHEHSDCFGFLPTTVSYDPTPRGNSIHKLSGQNADWMNNGSLNYPLNHTENCVQWDSELTFHFTQM